jgi:UDP-N-acetylglucosamine--N-acetylmuramyl-(pentapeptide) pyrophosphoryl-undecaprenol N-acetylglucosamine transferase
MSGTGILTVDGTADVLITGGGTGGHVYPALAVADELVRRGRDRRTVRFVGARRGLEATAVPAAGYAIDLLPGRGIRRSLTPRAIVANVGAVAGLAGAFLRAIGLVHRRRPRVVLGVGGYASAPCVVAARLRRVPAVVHEQNAAPGIVNRLAVRLGARAAASLPDTTLSGAVLTGNPVRAEIAAVVRAPVADPALVVVVGGSLGARTLNDAALALYDRWRARSDVSVRHVSGPRDHERCAAELAALRAETDRLDYVLVPYEDDMARDYRDATLFVCRAGAVTCAELTVTGTPAVLVPLPGAPADHQTRNAEALRDAGAARMITDPDLDGAALDAMLDELLGAPELLATMSAAARRLGHPDAASRVADLVEAAAGAGRARSAAR